MRKHNGPYLLVLLICFLFGITACSSNHVGTKTEFISNTIVQPMDSVLVIAVSKHKERSIRYEKLLVAELERAGIKAISAHHELPKDTPMSREVAGQQVKEFSSQGVVVTRLVDAKINRNKKDKRTQVIVDKPAVRSLRDVFTFDFTEVNALSEDEISTTEIVSTEVFSATDGTKLAAFETKVEGVQDGYSKMKSSASSITNKLKTAKLIR